jgi:hypothetical protein
MQNNPVLDGKIFLHAILNNNFNIMSSLGGMRVWQESLFRIGNAKEDII